MSSVDGTKIEAHGTREGEVDVIKGVGMYPKTSEGRAIFLSVSLSCLFFSLSFGDCCGFLTLICNDL